MTLRVKLEIVPFGYEDEAYEIGRLDIFNMGPAQTLNPEQYEYGVINLSPADQGLYIDTLHHRRKAGAWALVRNAIDTLKISGPHD